MESNSHHNLFNNETNRATMTDEQINVAIAAACGWENLHRHPLNPNVWVGENAGMLEEVLDYCTDLNAMHEAEKVLTDDQFKLYSHWVEKLMPNTGFRFLLCATASQRAEAFVRSIGKWEEVQP